MVKERKPIPEGERWGRGAHLKGSSRISINGRRRIPTPALPSPQPFGTPHLCWSVCLVDFLLPAPCPALLSLSPPLSRTKDPWGDLHCEALCCCSQPLPSLAPERQWISGGGNPAYGIRQRTDEDLGLKLTPDPYTGLLSRDKRRDPLNTGMRDLTPELSLNVQGCHLLASEDVLLPARQPPARQPPSAGAHTCCGSNGETALLRAWRNSS